MKKFAFIPILIYIQTASINAQDNSFYAKGYLLNNKDTSWTKIWFNPNSPYFQEEITVWQNEETKTISLADNKELTGFGIIEEGYQIHFGKVRSQGLKSWLYFYAKKIVTGTVELYELPLFAVRKDPESYKLLRENYSDYYIARTDNNSTSYPTLLNQLKKNKISPFLKGYPGLADIPNETLTPERLAELIKQYNTWYKNSK